MICEYYMNGVTRGLLLRQSKFYVLNPTLKKPNLIKLTNESKVANVAF